MFCGTLWRNSPWMTSETAQKRLAFLFSFSGHLPVCHDEMCASGGAGRGRRHGVGSRWLYVDMTYLEIIAEVPQESGDPGLHRETLRMVASD